MTTSQRVTGRRGSPREVTEVTTLDEVTSKRTPPPATL
jgi:hypothetical protein